MNLKIWWPCIFYHVVTNAPLLSTKNLYFWAGASSIMEDSFCFTSIFLYVLFMDIVYRWASDDRTSNTRQLTDSVTSQRNWTPMMRYTVVEWLRGMRIVTARETPSVDEFHCQWTIANENPQWNLSTRFWFCCNNFVAMVPLQWFLCNDFLAMIPLQ